VLFTSIHNINYFNHFLYCSFGGPYGLLVTQERSTAITADVDGSESWRRGFAGNLSYTDWELDNYGVPEHEVALHATGAMVRKIARTYPHGVVLDTWAWF
jgi:hypothetical protein